MRAAILASLALIVSLLLCGCDLVSLERPLTNAWASQSDPRLEGTWYVAGQTAGDYSILHIGLPSSKAKLPRALLLGVLVSRKAGKVDESGQFVMWPTTVGNHSVLHFGSPPKESVRRELLDAGWSTVEKRAEFHVVRYELRSDTMSWWGLDVRKVKHLIEQGKLKGEVDGPDDLGQFARITPPGNDALLELLSTNPDLVVTSKPAVLRRVVLPHDAR